MGFDVVGVGVRSPPGGEQRAVVDDPDREDDRHGELEHGVQYDLSGAICQHQTEGDAEHEPGYPRGEQDGAGHRRPAEPLRHDVEGHQRDDGNRRRALHEAVGLRLGVRWFGVRWFDVRSRARMLAGDLASK